MPEWKRVRDKDTGHEYSTQHVLTGAHEVLDKPAADAYGRPYAAKPRVNLPKATPDTPSTEGEEPPSTDAGPTRSARRRS